MSALIVGLLLAAGSNSTELAAVTKSLQGYMRPEVAQACFEPEAAKHPGLSGDVTLRLSIDFRGRVFSVSFDQNTTGDEDLGNCLKVQAKAWKFPPRKRGRPVEVTVPWVFHAVEEPPPAEPAAAAPAPQPDTRIAVVDVSPAFAPGPYTALKIDSRDPRILAVGTQEGFVSWSDDSGTTAHDSAVMRPRSYQYMGLRSDDRSWTQLTNANGFNNAVNLQPLVSPSWNETAASTAQSVVGLKDIASAGLQGTSEFGAASNASQFADDDMPAGDRLFMNLLNAGKPTLRWQRWMSVDDLQAPIGDVAFVGSGGKIMAATTVGIHVSDRERGAWIQAIGIPHPRRSSIQEYDPDGAGIQGTAVAIDPGDPSHVLAGTSAGLMVSSNGGESFFPHLDPKLADDPIFHFIWSADSPDRVLALTSRSVLVSKDRGRTFAVALSTSADLNALSIGQNATFAATHDGLLQVGFDGKVTKFLKDEVVVGVIALTPTLLLVATETVLEVFSTEHQEPLILKRAHAADPFVALSGTAELSYALTKNGIYRISSAGPPPPPHGRQPELRLTLSETEDRVVHLQHLVKPDESRFMRFVSPLKGIAAYFLPQVSLMIWDTYGTIPTVTQSGLLVQLPYSQTSGTTFSDVGFFINANFTNLPNIFYGRVPNPLNIKQQNLRPVKEDVLNQVRARYRACAELIRALQHPPDDPVQELLLRMRIQEYAAYLDAMAGEPVVLIDEED